VKTVTLQPLVLGKKINFERIRIDELDFTCYNKKPSKKEETGKKYVR